MPKYKDLVKIRRKLGRMRKRLVLMDESIDGEWIDAKCRSELRWLAFTAMSLDAGQNIQKTYNPSERSAIDLANLAGRNGQTYRAQFNRELKQKNEELAHIQAEITRLESVLSNDLVEERRRQARQLIALAKLKKLAGRGSKK